MNEGTSKKSSFRVAVEIGGGIITVVTVISGFQMYVDHRIEQKINEPAFINKIAASVRPSIIFDDKKRILADLGGLKYIDSIDIKNDERGNISSIIIKPKVYLAIAPLLTSLDRGDSEIKPSRGEGLIWIYEIRNYGFTQEASGVIRFRIEVLVSQEDVKR